MKRAGILALGIALLPLAAAAQPSLVLLGGKIFTNDPAKPFVQAIAIKGDTILATGTDAQIEAIAGDENTRRIRLNRAVVIPGINDAHTHPGCGPVGLAIGTGPDSTSAQLAQALGAAVDETPPDLWLIGTIGAPVMLDETVNRAKLDQLAPNRKVMLRSFTGHGLILSSRAIQEIGLAENIADPPGGRFGRNADGTLNGRVFEYAEYAAVRKIAAMTQQPGDLTGALRNFANEAIGFGITSVQAMPITEDDAAFEAAMKEVGSPLRVRHIFFPLSLPPALPREAFLPKGTNGIKWILDGTPLEKGAAVRTPYASGGSGQLNFTTLPRLIKPGVASDQQLLFHASGDQTVATLLTALQNTPNVHWPQKRPRIEHADGLLPDLDAQARDLGIVVVLNPSHFFFRTLFPEGRFMRAKSLLAIPLKVAIGSDGPLNPYFNIMLATNRPDNNPREALTREEAVAAYTLGSAFAEGRDDKGVLAPGMLADLAVLNKDIFTVPASQLPDTRSVLTIIGGKIVHKAPE